MATVRVNQDGKAPAGLKTGDKVVTGGGTYEIKGINADGSYKSQLADKSQTTGNYKGSYDRTVQDTVQSALNGMGQKVRETIRKNNIGKKSGGGSYTPLVQSDVDYDQKYLSADDYQAMKAFKNSYAYWQGVGGEAGQRGMKAAHDGAQALRAAAGYQALEDGSGYVPLAQRYQQEEAPEYEGSQWDDTLDRVANRLIGMNYADWTQGDQYQALADRYGQQGRMSMQDVMGQISSRTGGLASSYAGTVAQQQYNNYMTKLEEAAREDVQQRAAGPGAERQPGQQPGPAGLWQVPGQIGPVQRRPGAGLQRLAGLAEPRDGRGGPAGGKGTDGLPGHPHPGAAGGRVRRLPLSQRPGHRHE